MAQHDFIISDDIPKAVREDVNAAFLALATNNSGPSAPTVTYPYMFWADTSAAQELKIRNAANTAWIVVGRLNQANLGRAPARLGLTATGPVSFNNTNGQFTTVPRGELQRTPLVLNTTPSVFTGYPLFADQTGTQILPTQGASLMTSTITPILSNSLIKIDVNVVLTSPFELNFRGILAVFSNVSAVPIGATYQIIDRTETLRATFWHTSHNSTTPITYDLRFGATTDHPRDEDFFMNRGDTVPTLGNTTESWMQLTEIAP